MRRSAPQLQAFVDEIDAPRSRIKAAIARRCFYRDLSDSGQAIRNPARALVADPAIKPPARLIDALLALAAGRNDIALPLGMVRDRVHRARTREQLRTALRSRLP